MYDFRVLRGLCLLILCFIALPAFGQDDPNFEIGLKPYGSYHMGNIDTVSVGNGSLALDIPLISYPQRGGKLKLDFSFHYFNEGMYADQTCYPPPASICYWVPGSTNDLASGIIEKGGVWVSGTAASGLTGAMFQVTEPDGDSHVLGVTATNLLESIDASSYKVTYNPSSGVSTVTDAKGTIYTPTAPTCSSYTPCPSAPREDANGNQITFSTSSGWTDTMGRSIPLATTSTNPSEFTGCTGTPPIVSVTLWNPPGVNGGTYPVKLCFGEGYDRPTSATDQTTLVNYANTVHYWAGGSPCWATYGSAITGAETYNPRLQPSNMQVTGSVVAYPGSCSGLGQTGNLLDLSYNFNLGSGDNSNVMEITNNRDTTRSQTFGYDALNRFLTAETTSTYSTSPSHCWGEAYVFDNNTTSAGAWGNLTNINVATTAYNGCSQESLSVTATAQNQVSGGTYDTAGNLTYISGAGGGTFSFNAENQMTQAVTSTTTGYVYDGDGKRAEKTTSGAPYKLYWYGVEGSVLDETDQSGSTSNNAFSEYVFFRGQRIGRRDYSNNVYYYGSDHLGTSRVMAEVPSGGTTATLCYDADFYPFGGERAYTTVCIQNYKFTGKERDSESGLDNFGARYNASTMGRFMSPDPIFVTKHRIVDPQQWNMYAYVRNNPTTLTDPTGKDLWEKGCGKNSDTCNNDYVGSWDKDHKNFTPTTIQSDKNGNFDGHNVTMDTSGIHVDGKYQGVFASGTSATVVNGTGNLSGFQASFNGNCLGHCEAVGTISALPGHSFSQLLSTLRGPNEKLDRFSGHEGDQYRGGNKDGPDMHISYLSNRDSQSMHFDWAFPFGSVGGFAQHSADFVEIGIDKMLGQKSDPPYDEVGP